MGETVLKTGAINAFLRSLTLGSKFFLLLFLAHEISPSELVVTASWWLPSP